MQNSHSSMVMCHSGEWKRVWLPCMQVRACAYEKVCIEFCTCRLSIAAAWTKVWYLTAGWVMTHFPWHWRCRHSGLNIRAQNIKATLQHAGLGHATVFLPWLSDWGCHHSKFFLVQYPTGLRVIITTANMIQCDCSSKSQGIWWQDFPRRVCTAIPPCLSTVRHRAC